MTGFVVQGHIFEKKQHKCNKLVGGGSQKVHILSIFLVKMSRT